VGEAVSGARSTKSAPGPARGEANAGTTGDAEVLVFTRKAGQRVMIGDSIVVTVLDVHKAHVDIGIDAPPDVEIDREEVRKRVAAEGRRSPA
jgi:carbon storage regulator